MTLDYQSLLYAPIYNEFGIAATLTTSSGTAIDLTARNLTQASTFTGYGVDYQSFRPMAIVRMSEISSLGDDLNEELTGGAELLMAGKSWSVKSWEYAPSPNGTSDGEVRLILKDDLDV